MPRHILTRELVRWGDKRGAAARREILQEVEAATVSSHALGGASHTAATLAELNAKISDANLSDKRGIAFYIDGTLAVETTAMSFVVPVGLSLTIASVSMAVDTAPTGATLIVDVHKNGTTIFTTQGNRPTIAISGTSVTSSAPDVTSLTAGDKVAIEIDQVGSTVAGENLAVTVNCTEA